MYMYNKDYGKFFQELCFFITKYALYSSPLLFTGPFDLAKSSSKVDIDTKISAVWKGEE